VPKKENKVLGPPVGYTDLLDYAIKQKLTSEKEENSQKKSTAYYPLRPSSSGFCGRRLAYELMEYKGLANYDKEILSPQIYRLFDLGYSVEYSVLKMFNMVKLFKVRYKQQSLTCLTMKPVKGEKKGKMIEGSCDAFFISDKFKCIMDVKSAKDSFSRSHKTRWESTLEKFNEMDSLTAISETAWYAGDVLKFVDELGEDFLKENIYQLNLYACSDFVKERGVDHAVIYKYNKNDSRHYEIRFKPSQILADRVKDKFDRVNKAVSENKDPEQVERDYALGAMHCSFCPFKVQCWPHDDTKKAFFGTLPKKEWPTDIGRLKKAKEASKLFAEFEKLDKNIVKRKDQELKVLTLMQKEGIEKIKLDNGHVYEVKSLKSPRPHFELRRTKL